MNVNISRPRNRNYTLFILKIIVLVICLILVLFPLFSMIMTSFKTYDDLIQNPTSILPTTWVWDNFLVVFKDFPFFRYLLNTLILEVCTVLGNTISAALVAYGFARFKCKLKKPIFYLMIATMFIPGQVLQIPLFEMYSTFGWFNTYLPMILPSVLGGGIANVFLMRQFMEAIPEDIFEAAKIDGSNEFKTFIRVVVPLCKPIIITVAIFTFVATWNDFFSPLLYLTDENMYNLAYGLYIAFSKFTITGYTQWNIVSAANLLVTIPLIVLYFFCQKYFIEGITIGAVKG